MKYKPAFGLVIEIVGPTLSEMIVPVFDPLSPVASNEVILTDTSPFDGKQRISETIHFAMPPVKLVGLTSLPFPNADRSAMMVSGSPLITAVISILSPSFVNKELLIVVSVMLTL